MTPDSSRTDIPSSSTLLWDLIKRFVPLFVVVGAIAGGLMIYQLRNYYTQEVNQRLRQRTSNMATMVQKDLESLRNQAQLITQNGLVVNSTVDVKKRAENLVPFFNTLDFKELDDERISLHDYRGRPITSNSQYSVSALSENLIQATKRRGGYLKIRNRTFLMILPVRIHGNIEGYLSINGDGKTVDGFFSSVFLSIPDDVFVGVKNSSGQYIWKNRDSTPFENAQFAAPNEINLPSVSLTLSYSERTSALYGIMNELTLELILLLLVGFFLTLGGLVWMSRRIITPLADLTRRLKDKERQFRQMSETIDQAFYLAEPDFSEILYANPAIESLYGVTPDDCYDDPMAWNQYIPDAALEQIIKEFENHTFRPNSEPLQQEFPVNLPNDEQKQVRSKIYPVFNDDSLQQLVGVATDVTEEKRLEREIKQQRQFLRSVIDSQPQLIFVKDWEGYFRLANDSLAEIFGAPREEIEGQKDDNFVEKPEEVENFREDDRQVMESGEIKEIPEEPLTDPRTGEVHWYETIKVPLFLNRPPEQRQILGVATEITKRLETQQELEEQNRRLSLAKRAGTTGIWEYDLDSGELNWDQEMIDIFGRDAEDYDDYLECLHPEDREEVDSAVERAVEDGDSFHEEYRIRRDGDGDVHWIDAHAVVQETEDGPDKLIGSCQDITERKQDEKFLRRLNTIASDTDSSFEEKIQDVLELGSEFFGLPLGFVTHIDERTQTIEYVYGQHPEIKSGASEDLSKAYCQKTIQEDAPVFLNSTEEVKEVVGSEPYDTFGLSCYLGGKLPFNGGVYGTVCFADLSDQTDKDFDENDRAKLEIIIQWIKSQMERKRAFEDIKQAQQEAEEANQAKSQFLARMSHEIRTPLNAIMGMADLLSETSLDNEQQHYVTVFQNSSEILLNLINDILDLSKIEAGELELNPNYFNIEQLVIDTAEFFAEKAHGKGLELNAFVDPECPPAVKADKNRLRQILVNLIGNAIKFTDDGEINVNLTLENRTDETVKLQLEVQDTGEGISDDEQTRIFEEFAQTDESSTREHSGTGLGLSISQNLVAKMGGTIDVESELGQGSTFFIEVSFPYREEPVDDSPLQEVDLDRLDGHSVLIVDDNATNREILTKYLTPHDVDVSTCRNGEDALAQLEKDSTFDVIFLDNRMPGLSGYDVIDQLPGEYEPKDVVMLTSDGMKKNRMKSNNYDLGGFHIKPISRGQLLTILVKQLFGPLEQEEDTGDESVKPTTDKTSETVTGNLLLVEDDDNNRILVSSYLKEFDIEIDDAVNGEQALESMKENTYDLVLMDLDMPVMDGYDATANYREWEVENRDSRITIVALSAHAMEQSQSKAEESGCDDYLSKPIKKDKLLQTVRSYLES